MPDVQKVNALIEIVDVMLAVQEAELKRHGDFANRDLLATCRKRLDQLKAEK